MLGIHKHRGLMVLGVIALLLIIAVVVIYPKIAPPFTDTCRGFSDARERNACYSELAAALNITEPCNLIAGNPSMADSCYAKVNIANVNRLGCEDIRNVQARGYCLAEVAAVRAELPICENIDDTDWKDVCYSNIADATNKSEICGNIANSVFADDCFDSLAKKVNYGVSCAFIKDSVKRDRCFLAVGVASSNENFCQEINGAEFRWTCLQRIAKIKKSFAICDQMGSDFPTQRCYEAVNETILAAK